MKKLNKYLTVCLVLFLCSLELIGQGIIRGKLIEDESALEIIGGTILVAETGQGAVTDIDGSFSILSLTEGTYTIICSYLGFQELKITDVEVKGSDVTFLGEIRMIEEGVELSEVVVTAKQTRNNENAMQTLQRKSVNTVDAISSQAFSLRGDSDAASAMQRVTGVSVQNGKYVYVRGLSDRYSKTLLNGASIPGLDPDKNTVQMDLFHTNLIDNIVVFKNFTPDLPGDFSGGLVDITTKDFPEDFTLSVNLGTKYSENGSLNDQSLSYNGSSTDWLGRDDGSRDFPPGFETLPLRGDALFELANGNPDQINEIGSYTLSLNNDLEPYTQSQPLGYNGSILIGNQFNIGKTPIGFIANLTYDNSNWGYANGVTGRWNAESASAPTMDTLRYLNDNQYGTDVLIGGMISLSAKLGTTSKISANILRNQSGSKATRYQEGINPKASSDIYQERTLLWTERGLTTYQLTGEHRLGESQQWEINWLGSYTNSKMSQPDTRYINNFVNILPNGDLEYIIDLGEDIPPSRFTRSMDENNLDTKVDGAYNFTQWKGLKSKIQGGISYLEKDRQFTDIALRYSPNGDASDFNNYVTPETVISSSNINGVFVENTSELRNQYDAGMKVGAAYLMTELPINSRLKSVLGVRAEKTTLNFTSGDPSLNLNDTKLLDQVDILPAVNLIYELQPDKMNARVSFSQTVARPTFREIAPITIFDFAQSVNISGNQDLKITNITNLDARWEYFMGNGDVISVSGFYKNFKNPIELTITPISEREWLFRNVDNGRVLGGEIEIRKNLGFISAALNHFSIGANVTIIESRVDIPEDEYEAKKKVNPDQKSYRDMFGQSPYIVNGYLQFINKSGTSANLSYNVQGERLTTVSLGTTPDIYEQPFSSLNFKVSQRFAKNFAASFSVNNILNSEQKLTQEFKGNEYIYNGYKPGLNMSLGIAYNLSVY